MLGINSVSDIDTTPSVFYWYEMSQASVKSLDGDLSAVRTVWKKPPGFAARIQNNIASMLQDTFWLINQSNQVRINESLHRFLQDKVPANHKIVLYGYSGGAIIDVNYLMNYLPYLDLYEKASHDPKAALPDTLKEKLKDPELRYTCLKALEEKQIIRYDTNGNLVFFLENMDLGNSNDLDSLRNRYLTHVLPDLKKANQNFCLPANRLKGIVTFGSPVAALTVRSLNSPQAQLYVDMSRYLINHDIFWMNLNRLNDPLGYSIPADEVESALSEHYKVNIYGADKGFIYNNVLYQNRVFFYRAHFWYLKQPMIFANALVDNLKDGYLKHLEAPKP